MSEERLIAHFQGEGRCQSEKLGQRTNFKSSLRNIHPTFIFPENENVRERNLLHLRKYYQNFKCQYFNLLLSNFLKFSSGKNLTKNPKMWELFNETWGNISFDLDKKNFKILMLKRGWIRFQKQAYLKNNICSINSNSSLKDNIYVYYKATFPISW